jgi:hypothetical protein
MKTSRRICVFLNLVFALATLFSASRSFAQVRQDMISVMNAQMIAGA